MPQPSVGGVKPWHGIAAQTTVQVYSKAMARPIKSFRELEVGDRVRLVEIPKFYRVGYNIHRDTMWVYRQILVRRRPMRICLIDEWGLPYVHCRFRRKNGRWRDDWLGLDKEGWALVEKR